MAANTRPYFITYEGIDRMVEAPNPASAVRHVVGKAVTELRPARGAEVLGWTKAGKPIEVAGEKVAAVVTSEEQEDGSHAITGMYSVEEAFEWLKANRSDDTLAWSEALNAWQQIVAKSEMDLSAFDHISAGVPLFAELLTRIVIGVPANSPVTSEAMATLRGAIEDTPFQIVVVLGAIKDQVDYERALPVKDDGPTAA